MKDTTVNTHPDLGMVKILCRQVEQDLHPEGQSAGASARGRETWKSTRTSSW